MREAQRELPPVRLASGRRHRAVVEPDPALLSGRVVRAGLARPVRLRLGLLTRGGAGARALSGARLGRAWRTGLRRAARADRRRPAAAAPGPEAPAQPRPFELCRDRRLQLRN